MTLVIAVILIIGYVLIATENFNHINKAAVAMFIGVCGWILYMCNGSNYVMSEHADNYLDFLNGMPSTSSTVKDFISQNVFLKYITNSCEIVLFLLATMGIVEVLNNNGCFDFISEWLRTRKSKRLLWSLAIVSYLISANLDNITTAAMMLVIMHTLVENSRMRMYYAAIIVLAVNCGGSFTVIGDITGLALWVKGAVTPTNYSAALFLPSLVAMAVPTWLVSRKLPEYLDISQYSPRFRGDDTTLNRWQRILMLVVGIGGLWFIPTFHRITHLSPFVGALCVLSLLWIVNELCNRKLMNADQMVMRRLPHALQYRSVQAILFFIGVSLAVGAIHETGALRSVASWCHDNISNIYILSIMLGAISCVLDNIVVVLTNLSMFPIVEGTTLVSHSASADYTAAFMQDGSFWQLVSYCSALGGSILTIGTMTGYVLMKAEGISLFWYFRYMSGKVFLGWLAGLSVYFLTTTLFV